MGDKCGRRLSYEDCLNAWLGYRKDLPKRNLVMLSELRKQGYRLILVSNTNPFMMAWADSDDFDGEGHPISHYFHRLFLSYKVGAMKPEPAFFNKLMAQEKLIPAETLFIDDGPRNVAAASQMGIRTLCPVNGGDWTGELSRILGE